MKKVVFGVIISCIAFLSFGFTQIKMEEYNGVYRVPCTVNGAKMKFIFDTGASNVCISLAMAQYLYENDYISDDDLIGTGHALVADGRITDHLIINLKDLEIGGMHFCNVQAYVSESQNAPLLFGQSAIKKFGSFNIVGDNLTIFSLEDLQDITMPGMEQSNSTLNVDSIVYEVIDSIGTFDNSKQIKSLIDQLNSYLDLELYKQADEVAQQLYDMNELPEMGIAWWAYALQQEGNYSKAIDVANLITDFDWWKSGLPSPFSIKGNIYSNLEMPEEAIESRLLGIHTLKYSKLELAEEYSLISAEYGSSEQYKNGVIYSKKAFQCLADYLKMPYAQLWNLCFSPKSPLPKKISKSLFDTVLGNLCLNYYNNDLWNETQMNQYQKILARKGLYRSIRYCNRANIKF